MLLAFFTVIVCAGAKAQAALKIEEFQNNCIACQGH